MYFSFHSCIFYCNTSAGHDVDYFNGLVQAETAYVCATSITDSQPPGWQGLAEVYKRMGNKDKATPVLQKLVREMALISGGSEGIIDCTSF